MIGGRIAADTSATTLPGGWQYGLDPAADGSVIRTLTRRDLPVGEALRIEMVGSGSAEVIHVQYYVATEAGGWALWVSGSPEALVEAEAVLPELVMPPEADAPAE